MKRKLLLIIFDFYDFCPVLAILSPMREKTPYILCMKVFMRNYVPFSPDLQMVSNVLPCYLVWYCKIRYTVKCLQNNNDMLFPSLGFEINICSLVLTFSLTNSDELEFNAFRNTCRPRCIIQVWRMKNQSWRDTLLCPIE